MADKTVQIRHLKNSKHVGRFLHLPYASPAFKDAVKKGRGDD